MTHEEDELWAQEEDPRLAWPWEQGLKTSQASSGRKEPPLGRSPRQGPRLQAVPSCPPLLWLRPVSWLHNEPLSVWSLLVLAPNSLWNQAQILETAPLKKKHQSPGRDQPELSIHSLIRETT